MGGVFFQSTWFACLTLKFLAVSSNEWRPIFKISDNSTDFGGYTDVFNFWISGDSTFSSYTSDVNYITNTFDATSMESTNYRSLIIDDWIEFYNAGSLDKIKISLYKDGSETVYFTFDVTNDLISWFSQSHLIESPYLDLNETTSVEYFSLQGIDSMYLRLFYILVFVLVNFFFLKLLINNTHENGEAHHGNQ